MNNGDMPAMPQSCVGLEYRVHGGALGLTKREAFALAVMQELLVNDERNGLAFKDISRKLGALEQEQ